MISITDVSDSRIESYRSVRFRDPQQGFIAEGAVVVQRLLKSEYSIRSLLIHKGQEHRYENLVADRFPVYVVDPDIGEQIAGYDFHRGVLAHGECPPMCEPSQLTHARPPIGLGLFGISDPENVGSLLRSAAAMGIHDILIGPGTISPYVRRVIRVSMASVFQHRFYQVTNSLETINELQKSGVEFAATTLRKDAIAMQDFTSQPPAGPVVLLVGNEASGLQDEVQDACLHRVTLPMSSGTDSLNVGVAGAIFLYELMSRKCPS
ncbi:TrmH family RNA methyltransferase [Neorhodopirellula lusitana]|uniref:TrmH family RNA methyltransferase n=1 Tax=Neorhodopirellula lusitana TaxID=445327 RepID=UPI00384DA5B2